MSASPAETLRSNYLAWRATFGDEVDPYRYREFDEGRTAWAEDALTLIVETDATDPVIVRASDLRFALAALADYTDASDEEEIQRLTQAVAR